MQPESIEALVGKTFLKKKGHSEKDRETLFSVEDCGVEEFKHTHKFLGLMFSASWCPPCKSFLQILKEFYSEVNIDSKQFEILYVSLDQNEGQFQEHYAQMPWLAVPFADQDRMKALRQRYRVVGIPQLVVLKSEDGGLVTVRGRKDIHDRGVKTMADWHKTVELNKEREEQRKKEEQELEILRLKLTQLQLERSQQLAQQMQQQQTDSTPVIGANLA